jgi:hypothetical protein
MTPEGTPDFKAAVIHTDATISGFSSNARTRCATSRSHPTAKKGQGTLRKRTF